MAKYLFLFLVLGSLLCAPAARANQCAVERPNQYHPALTWVTSPTSVEFELRQGAFTTEIRNVSSDAVYLLDRASSGQINPAPPDVSQPLPAGLDIRYKIVDDSLYYWNSQEWILLGSGFIGLTVYNQLIYIVRSSQQPPCDNDGGIKDEKSIPAPQNILIKILYKENFIDIPAILEYKPDPNYAEKLKYYNEPREIRNQQIFNLVLIGSMIVAVILFFIFILIRGITNSMSRRQQK